MGKIEGRNIFHKLCHIIEKLYTNDNTGKILEENLCLKFWEESKQYQQCLKNEMNINSNRKSNDSEISYYIDGELEKMLKIEI